MKKNTLLKSLLILMPILAVGLATTRDSVIVFDAAAGLTSYYSYFDLVPGTDLQILPPLAGILCIANGICAAVYLARKPEWSAKGMAGTSFAAATVAGIPVLIQGQVKVVPNVGLPIAMIIAFFVAYHFLKDPEKAEEKKKAPKLKKR